VRCGSFCVWPICPATRSTALAGMKQSFGARPVRSCLRSMPWIDANLRIEGSAFETGKEMKLERRMPALATQLRHA
jgi:hypothetical protein